MDLGIKGKRALVCASSKGLGRGCAEALAQAGVSLGFEAHGGGHDMGPPQMLVKLSAFLKGRRESIMAVAAPGAPRCWCCTARSC